jgi:hypothetical protein
MDKFIHLKFLAALLLITLSLNAADLVTGGQTVTRTRSVQSITSTQDVSVSISATATNITYLWEIWNLGTNTITITNGIAGTNVTLGASALTGLRAIETNQWRVIYGVGR